MVRNFVVADDAPHARVKNLGAAARQRIHARLFHFEQRILDRKLRNARVVVHLDHRERLQVHVREALLQAAD
jgi:hypothetical protein